jgi:hypothetical protein
MVTGAKWEIEIEMRAASAPSGWRPVEELHRATAFIPFRRRWAVLGSNQ